MHPCAIKLSELSRWSTKHFCKIVLTSLIWGEEKKKKKLNLQEKEMKSVMEQGRLLGICRPIESNQSFPCFSHFSQLSFAERVKVWIRY